MKSIQRCFFLFLVLLFFYTDFQAQGIVDDYYLLREKYFDFKENDARAFPYLNEYIKKAKREKKYSKLVLGYKDGVFSSADTNDKLRYADSTIWAAHLSKDATLISNAYAGKGIVYYFNLKKYQLALDEYLKAYEYSKTIDDEYEKNKIIYHIGVVKSYIGYYDEALVHFKKILFYYESVLKKRKLHPNTLYNNKKGYYNSLHQMIVCFRNLGQHKTADSLLTLGMTGTFKDRGFQTEYAYFCKEKGIKEFRENKYLQAVSSLEKSLPRLLESDDFAWLAISYFYIGKSYVAGNNTKKGIGYLQKADSIFTKKDFILPELRENYELLITHYKKEGNVERELYFTKQLLKADRIISKDFAYLSSKIYKEYDTKTLLEEKSKLEKNSSLSSWVMICLGIIVLMLIVVLVIKYIKEKENKDKYKMLEQKLLEETKQETVAAANEREGYKLDLDRNIVNDIILKLKKFEDNIEFTENGLSLSKLATRFDTNSSYLSQVINETKGTNFKRYLGELRIHYITKKLYEDKKYLHFKIETLATECGIASRTNFSNIFQEINGMRPADFIKKRLEDIKKESLTASS
ncbi:helix-turn-helix domain-containing protein [Chryseobacterium indologenes]|uniref:helix-turn-helix domain-containing protein n=1 Tax=Chryseobacterium indologenes TaxID=253 RepID=UPI001109731A|nr:helix-turn-helix domain-containing protein [Chryseobacterium indologenes]TLX23673.1 helix-turn-helix domain-containing protein [Chryseobacterium indologenes]